MQEARRADSTTDSAAESLAGGEPVGIPSLGQALGALAAAVGRTAALNRESMRLTGDLARIIVGASAIEVPARDRRFADPTWTSNPVYRRTAQSYMAAAQALQRLVEDREAESGHKRAEQARFTANLLIAAAAPTNFLPGNPAALKRAFETGGASVVRGVRNLASDLRHNGGMPATVPRGVFQVGRDLALSAGAVVARDELAEVIQYSPAQDEVFERPVLIIPPPIGRYYFLDLRPERSFVEYASGRGLQTFLVSWRNPSPAEGCWDLDHYAARVSGAIETVREVTGSPTVNLIGFCAGGIIATTLLNHLAATGDDRVHTISYAVTLLDFSLKAPLTAFSGQRLLNFARRRSARSGVITSRQMGAAFTWMRPDDLVFSYWVNNYLMGEQPPAFDILAWNADGTNLPAALHGQFIDIFEGNLLAVPGAMSVLGTPLQLNRIMLPTFVTGAVADHLTPWKGCYRTTQLLGGDSTFVLSHSGHIASLVNPPGNPKAHYWTGPAPGPDPDAWLAGAEKRQGSWWEPWADWVTERAGNRRPAPADLGSGQHPVLDPAPGRYVRDMSPHVRP